MATIHDADQIQDVYRSAFDPEESGDVAQLAVELLFAKTIPGTLSLVALENAEIAGHVALSPVNFDSDENWLGYILAPLAVKPEHQNRKLGSRLVQYGIDSLTESGVNLLFVYGDPKYYGRFGFDCDLADQFIPPYPLQYPFGWQAKALNKISVTNQTAKISCVNALCRPELW